MKCLFTNNQCYIALKQSFCSKEITFTICLAGCLDVILNNYLIK